MLFHDGMICPVCEDGELEMIVQDEEFDIKGHKVVLKGLKSFSCRACEESFFNKEDRRVIEKILADEKRIIEGYLTSHQIKSVREYYGLSQVEFAKFLGVGEKNFARYENGSSIQERGMDLYLKSLHRDPSAIEVADKNYDFEKHSFRSGKMIMGSISSPINCLSSYGLVESFDGNYNSEKLEQSSKTISTEYQGLFNVYSPDSTFSYGINHLFGGTLRHSITSGVKQRVLVTYPEMVFDNMRDMHTKCIAA